MGPSQVICHWAHEGRSVTCPQRVTDPPYFDPSSWIAAVGKASIAMTVAMFIAASTPALPFQPRTPTAQRQLLLSFFTTASTRASRLGVFAVKSIGMPTAFIVSLVCGPTLPASGRFASLANFNAAA